MKKIITFGWIFVLMILVSALVSADNLNVSVCSSVYSCSAGTCLQNNTYACSAVTDICGSPFTGNLSDYNSVCVYPTPPENPTVTVVTTGNNGSADLQNITDLAIVSTVEPVNRIDFAGESINFTAVNVSYIVIEPRRISIDSVAVPELNRPARLTFTGVKEGHTLFRDGVECFQCTQVDYNKDTQVLIMDVPGFSEYTVGAWSQDDLILLTIDGIGTFLASVVSWVEILILMGVIWLGAVMVEKWRY
jgi:hypothetical protein